MIRRRCPRRRCPRPPATPVAGLALLGLAATLALTWPPSAIAQPRPLPGPGPQPAVPAAAAAPADTAVAVVSGPDGTPRPSALRVVPEAGMIGEPAALVIDFPAGTPAPVAADLTVDAPWGVVGPAPDLAAAALPATDGARVVLGLRPLRLGPWRAVWSDGGPRTAVQEVRGRLPQAAAAAPVRDPRPLGGLPRWLPWVLGALAVALALWVLWQRRRRPSAQETWPAPPPPAWMPAACALQALQRDGGHDRRFLDRLAGVVRRYLEDRYGLPATGMSAADLARTARAAAWPAGPLAEFAELLGHCDQARYAPGDVAAAGCRDALRQAVALIDATREQAVFAPAPAELAGRAAAAWQKLADSPPRAGEGGRAC